MYCLKCGGQMPDNGRFCPHCGADQYAAWNSPADRPVRQAAPPPLQSAPQSSPPVRRSQPANGHRKRQYVILTLFFLLVAAVAVWNHVLKPDIALPENKAYKPIVSQYSYNVLPTDVQRGLYKKIAKVAYRDYPQEYEGSYFFDNIPIKDGVTETDFYLAFKAFLDDHPEVFWLNWGTSYMGKKTDGPFEPNYFVVYSQYTPDELKALKEELYDALEPFMASVPAGLSEGELQQYAHDYLIDHCEYDYAALDANGNTDPDYVNINRVGKALGALADGKAVCAGYAAAYQLMLNRLGVECVTIFGQGHSLDPDLQRRTGRTDHAWNAVKDGGAWVMTDATWDDSEDPARRHTYFNISIQQMYLDHNAQAIDFTTFQYLSPYIQINTQTDCLFLPR